VRDLLLTWLKRHTKDARRSLSQFTGGGFLFTAGMMIIILTDQLMAESLQQELAALLGAVLTVLGLALAFWGYLSISVFKVLIYLLERKSSHE